MHTDPRPFEITWRRVFFRSSVAKNQFTGNKTINDSLLPESLTLNPEAMNPDLESIIKQTKHSI